MIKNATDKIIINKLDRHIYDLNEIKIANKLISLLSNKKHLTKYLENTYLKPLIHPDIFIPILKENNFPSYEIERYLKKLITYCNPLDLIAFGECKEIRNREKDIVSVRKYHELFIKALEYFSKKNIKIDPDIHLQNPEYKGVYLENLLYVCVSSYGYDNFGKDYMHNFVCEISKYLPVSQILMDYFKVNFASGKVFNDKSPKTSARDKAWLNAINQIDEFHFILSPEHCAGVINEIKELDLEFIPQKIHAKFLKHDILKNIKPDNLPKKSTKL